MLAPLEFTSVRLQDHPSKQKERGRNDQKTVLGKVRCRQRPTGGIPFVWTKAKTIATGHIGLAGGCSGDGLYVQASAEAGFIEERGHVEVSDLKDAFKKGGVVADGDGGEETAFERCQHGIHVRPISGKAAASG